MSWSSQTTLRVRFLAVDDVQTIVEAVRRDIDLARASLGDEFYPAHLSVALIDAVFSTRLSYEAQVVPIVERYCAHFGLSRVRKNRATLPQVSEQETISDLVRHYEELGPNGVQETIIKSRYMSPGTKILKSENVRHAALALQCMGVQTLQDAAVTSAHVIKCELVQLPGIGERTIHMFLMYAGDNAYVKGDVHVCGFVADALGRDRISPALAEQLVRAAADVLGITPRLLDNEIWKLRSGSSGK